jgi:2-iminoacetate synthase ThiH
MTDSDVQMLQENWHQAVRDHEQVAREARRHGLSAQEFHKIGRAYIMRVDAAYSRLKMAEATTGRC